MMASFGIAVALGDDPAGDGETEFQILASIQADDDVMDTAAQPIDGMRRGIFEDDGDDVGAARMGEVSQGAQKGIERRAPALAQFEDEAIGRLGGDEVEGLIRGVGQGELMAGVSNDFGQQIAGRRIPVQQEGTDQIKAAGVQ